MKGVQPGSREEMRLIRKNSTWVNMVIALAACVLLVVVVASFTPKLDGSIERDIDYKGDAEASQGLADFPLAVPDVPKGWTANEATFEPLGTPAFDTWYVSWVGPGQQWVALEQSQGDEAWASSLMEDAVEIGEHEIEGTTFTEYQGPDSKQYLSGEVADTLFVVKATAQWESVDTIVASAVDSVESSAAK